MKITFTTDEHTQEIQRDLRPKNLSRIDTNNSLIVQSCMSFVFHNKDKQLWWKGAVTACSIVVKVQWHILQYGHMDSNTHPILQIGARKFPQTWIINLLSYAWSFGIITIWTRRLHFFATYHWKHHKIVFSSQKRRVPTDVFHNQEPGGSCSLNF